MTSNRKFGATAPGEIRRLQLRLTALWSACWLVLLALASWSISAWHARALTSELDGDLGLVATGTYGLTWFDEQGEFEGSAFLREDEFTQSPFDIVILDAEELDHELLRSGSARYSFPGRNEIAASVRDSGEEYTGDQRASSEEQLRVHAIPTFLEDNGDEVRAVIIVAANLSPTQRARARFLSSMWVILLGLGAFGIALGSILSRLSMAPLAQSLRQREYFLAAAAHELRNPLAALRTICDTTPDDLSQASRRLNQANETCIEASKILDDLLLYARLDLGPASVECEPLRLDLLVEQCLPDSQYEVNFNAEECTVEGDPRLLTSLVQNLIRNAEKHGKARESGLSISVRANCLVVRDYGPGYAPAVLESYTHGTWLTHSSAGTGLGLSLCARIAHAHGTFLKISHASEGGAQAKICFDSPAEFSKSSAS